MRKRINKTQFSSFLEEIMKHSSLIAPVKTETHGREYQVVTDASHVALEGENPLRSPKEYIFPQQEKMYTFSTKKEGKYSVSEEKDNHSQVIVGIRPCDLHAIVYAKQFYASTLKDPYILRRAESTTLIGWACQNPRNTCFCTSLGNSPVDRDGADIMMAGAQDYYILEAITHKGKQLLEKVASLLDESPDSDKQIIPSIQEKTESLLRKRVDLPSIKGKVGQAYDSDIWKKYSNACISCGACTFNCPTCTCFDVSDHMETCKEGYHYRTWDTCQNYAFTLHASGHNPRGTKEERLRQRVMHKYHYSVVQLNEFSCTGCGRCTQSCPVGINMVSIITDIKEVIEHE